MSRSSGQQTRSSKDGIKADCELRAHGIDIFAFQREGIFADESKRRNTTKKQKKAVADWTRVQSRMGAIVPLNNADVDPEIFVIGGPLENQALNEATNNRTAKNNVNPQESVSVTTSKVVSHQQTNPPQPPSRIVYHQKSFPPTNRNRSARRSRLSSILRSKAMSQGEDFDPDLLETTDDEDNVFHAPFPCTMQTPFVTREAKRIYDNSLSNSATNKNRAAMSKNPDCPQLPPRPQSRRRTKPCKRSLIKWLKNNLCSHSTVKHR